MARLSTAGRMLGLARIVALGARVRSFLRQEVKSCRANSLFYRDLPSHVRMELAVILDRSWFIECHATDAMHL